MPSTRLASTRFGFRLGAILLVMLLSGVSGAAAAADPPRVIRAVPDNGDDDVDPALSALRIEFDQDMSPQGHSICGGGPSFPELTAPPRWEGRRTLILPVKLKPDFTYNLSINCPVAQNTRSADGRPAEMYPITFTTRSASAATRPAASQLTSAENRTAIQRLREAVEKQYAYRDLRGVDWAKVFAEFAPQLEAAPTPAAFGRQAARLLGRAEDLHNHVQVGDQTFPTHRRMVAVNANQATLARLVPGFEKAAEAVWTGRFEDGIGYINITSWPSDADAALKPALAALERFGDAPGLVIDVRFNGGGDESIARRFAARFVSRTAVYARDRFCDPEADGGFGPTLDRTIDPDPAHPPFKGKVAVLMGPAVVSSCESFVLMMKVCEHSRSFGQRSGGASGNPRPHDLGNGVTVFLSSWQDMTPDGVLFEGCGLAPDVEINAAPADFDTADPVLQAGLQWIRSS